MAKGTKVAIKVKGSAAGVKKALSQIISTDAAPPAPVLRQADFIRREKKNAQR